MKIRLHGGKMAEAKNRDLLNPGSGKPEITDRLHWNISLLAPGCNNHLRVRT